MTLLNTSPYKRTLSPSYRYVAVEQFRDRLVENNKHTYWVPDSVKVCTCLSNCYFDVIVALYDILLLCS
jgi:hypothetical protein